MITRLTSSLAATALAAGVLLAAGCSTESDSNATAGASEKSGPPVVHVVNYPLMYFADRIAGDAADVQFVAPGDGDPAFWEPAREDIAAMQSADRILLNGASYAKWLPGVSLPESRLVDTSAAIADRYIEIASDETHSHGGAGDHSHAGTAFTTWMDMQNARAQATAVREAMLALVPDAADAINANADALLADIDALDAAFLEAAEQVGDRPLVASHPVYQYFARRYGLGIESMYWEPEVVPDAAAMAVFNALLVGHPATVMIWEGDPEAESVALLEAVGVRSVIIDPCGNRPDAGDWLSVMQENVAALRSIAGDA